MLVAACAAGTSTGSTQGSAAAAAPSANRSAAAAARPVALQLVVTPHPDDELEGWSQVERHAQDYTVFVTMTQGEATGYCDPARFAANDQPADGEVTPTPRPQGKRTSSCRDARLASWRAVLDGAMAAQEGLAQRMARRDDQDTARDASVPETTQTFPALDGLPLPVDEGAGGAPSPSARTWIGPRWALFSFSAGDGDVTPAEVTWAVRSVLAQRGASLPDLPLDDVVAASYTNDAPDAGTHRAGPDGTCHDRPCTGDSRYAEYEHPDHLAVRQALLEDDLGARHGTWVVTWPSDPAATDTADVRWSAYRRLLGLGPRVDAADPLSLRRQGLMQRYYGWLGFPDGYWPPTQLPLPNGRGEPVIMARHQTFVHVGS